jgi:hypothetical protein
MDLQPFLSLLPCGTTTKEAVCVLAEELVVAVEPFALLLTPQPEYVVTSLVHLQGTQLPCYFTMLL